MCSARVLQATASPDKRGSANKQRTSQYNGVGRAHRKQEWQARIQVDGKVSRLSSIGSLCSVQLVICVYAMLDVATGSAEYASKSGGTRADSRGISSHSTSRQLWASSTRVQVTHLGYYTSEVEAARVHDKVALSLDNHAILNFDVAQYSAKEIAALRACKTRPELQRALGVKPMDKSSRYGQPCPLQQGRSASSLADRTRASQGALSH